MKRLAGCGGQGAREDVWACGWESAPVLFGADEWRLAVKAEDRVVLREVLAEPVVDRTVSSVIHVAATLPLGNSSISRIASTYPSFALPLPANLGPRHKIKSEN